MISINNNFQVITEEFLRFNPPINAIALTSINFLEPSLSYGMMINYGTGGGSVGGTVEDYFPTMYGD